MSDFSFFYLGRVFELAFFVRIGWIPVALALGAIIDKYEPTASFKNMAVFSVSCVGFAAWFAVYIVCVTIVPEMF